MTRLSVDRLSIRRRPTGLPLMRQWWGKLLFMHWPVAAASLRPLVAPHLSIDTYEGQAWVGVVPFYDAEMSLTQQGHQIVYSPRRTGPEPPPAVFDATWTFAERLPAQEPD